MRWAKGGSGEAGTRHWATLLAFVLATAFAPEARACAVCAASDPTLSPTGSEVAFAGRLKASLDLREGWVEAAGITVTDHRADLSARYAPSARWLLSIDAPVLLRQIDAPSVLEPSSLTRVVPGDAELRVDRVTVVWAWHRIRFRFSGFAELKIPTAPLEDDARGAPLPSVLQPGCGSLVPVGGASFVAGRGAWFFTSSASAWLPFAVRGGYHAGDSLRVGARIQWQPWTFFAVRGGGNVNADSSGTLAHDVVDPNSGGVIGYLAGEVAVSPWPDVIASFGALYPALTLLYGVHREGPIASASLSYDF
jgi:hypothetical protein